MKDVLREMKKLKAQKLTENLDISFNTTGNDLTDLLFMADYFTKNLEQVQLGTSPKEKLFAMYMRDPRDGKGFRDLGRKLMEKAGNSPDEIIEAGRFDDLWHIPNEANLSKLFSELEAGNSLAKKWMPRLGGKYHSYAQLLRKLMGISEKRYRKLIKATDTTEYKLSYAVGKNSSSPLNDLFGEHEYTHPLLNEIDFSKVPSLAMVKYFNAFLRKEETRERFVTYLDEVKEGKAKLHTATARVTDAYKVTKHTEDDSVNILAQQIVNQETRGLSLSAICVLDTSGSMTWGHGHGQSAYDRAMAVAHALATNSTYARNQLISFSSRPKLMTIRGETLKEQYNSMHTGDCSNTDLAKVFEILKELKIFPNYVIVLSDMEFDRGSHTTKEEWKELMESVGAPTRLVWWNFNARNKTVPEMDEYGNFFLSGNDLTSLMLLPGVVNMEEYIDALLAEYASKKFNKFAREEEEK